MFKARTLPTLHKTQNEQINKQTRIVIRYCENFYKKKFSWALPYGVTVRLASSNLAKSQFCFRLRSSNGRDFVPWAATITFESAIDFPNTFKFKKIWDRLSTYNPFPFNYPFSRVKWGWKKKKKEKQDIVTGEDTGGTSSRGLITLSGNGYLWYLTFFLKEGISRLFSSFWPSFYLFKYSSDLLNRFK